MNNDLISRSAVKNIAAKYGAAEDFDSLIDEIPAANAEPVRHGYWTFFKSIAGDEYTFECSICNEWADRRHNYCPNCGAKMDAEVSD